MTIALISTMIGIVAAGLILYLIFVFVLASSVRLDVKAVLPNSVVAAEPAPPSPVKAEDVMAITSLIEKALMDEKVEMSDWANARWSVGDPDLEKTMKKAWNMLGDWCRSDELLKRNPEVADKIRMELKGCLDQINDFVAGSQPPLPDVKIDQPV